MKSLTSFVAAVLCSTVLLSCRDNGQPAAPVKEETPECHHGINTTLTGRYMYKANHESRDCPPPGIKDMANADREADTNFTAYGETFCQSDNGCPNNPQGCKPDISALKNMGYRTEAEPAGEKFNCYVVATVNGTISCHCRQ